MSSKDMLGIAVRKLVTLPALVLGIVCDLLEKLADPDWVEATKKFLRKENPWPEIEKVAKAVEKILEFIATITVSAISEFEVKYHFDVGKVFGFIGSDFRKWFGEKIEEPVAETTLSYYKLKKASNDKLIIAELGGEEKIEVTLGQIRALIDLQPKGEKGILLTNGWANIFYVRDYQGVIRSVNVYWNSSYGIWDVRASSVDSPDRWYEGNQVFSRNS